MDELLLEEGDEVGLGFGMTLLVGIPLDQINFLPDFKQVKTYPLLVTLVPTFLHVVPAFGEAASALAVARSAMESTNKVSVTFALVTPLDLISGQ